MLYHSEVEIPSVEKVREYVVGNLKVTPCRRPIEMRAYTDMGIGDTVMAVVTLRSITVGALLINTNAGKDCEVYGTRRADRKYRWEIFDKLTS